MKVKKQEKSGNRVIIEVEEEDSSKYNLAKEKVFTRVAKEINIPGFRPGKAPREIIEKSINQDVLKEEILQELASDLYPQVITQTQIEPVDYPSIKITKDNPFTLEIEVDVYPEVKLGKYKGIEVKKGKEGHEGEEKGKEGHEESEKERDKIIEEVVKDTSVDIPEGMIRREIDVMQDELKFSLSQQGLQLEHYLASIKSNETQFREQLKAGATVRVKGKIVLRAVADKEKIKITDEEYKAEAENIAKESGQEIEVFMKSLGDGGRLYIEDYLLRRKALDFLVEKAKIITQKH